MKFGIITATYNRADKLTRCIDSVLQQTYSDYEIVIINDSPSNEAYLPVMDKYAGYEKIHLINNKQNSGVNFTRNQGLNSISPDVDWVIFLDDDDYLKDDALYNLQKIINENPKESWIVTNRAYSDGTKITFGKKGNGHYSYIYNYLLFRNFKGDATHCIKKTLINGDKKIRFATTIKQAEEWIFYFDLARITKFLYINKNTTLSDGYLDDGLTSIQNVSFKDKINNIRSIITEGVTRGSIYSPFFCFYVLIKLMFKLLK